MVLVAVVGIDSPRDVTAVQKIIQVCHGFTSRHLDLAVTDFPPKQAAEALGQEFRFHQQVVEVGQRQPMAVDDLIESHANTGER